MIPTLISVIQVELCRIRIVHVRFDLNPKGYVARVSALDAICQGFRAAKPLPAHITVL
jgi:hypothetical protein